MHFDYVTFILHALIATMIGLQLEGIRESREIRDRLKRLEIHAGINGKPKL